MVSQRPFALRSVLNAWLVIEPSSPQGLFPKRPKGVITQPAAASSWAQCVLHVSQTSMHKDHALLVNLTVQLAGSTFNVLTTSSVKGQARR